MNFLDYPANKIKTSNIDPNEGIFENAIILLPIITPIVCEVIEKLMSLAHDAMEHQYDIKVKVGPVDILLSKNN
ncbi:MAG TPA: hypothetical protein PLH64_04325 [Anaerolineaceae bacterium]|nr:hypothetical protein [Anaerolineaceae bacterium]